MAIKLIAVDLDGTLLTTNNTILPETERALKVARDEGVKVVLTTGRPLSGVMRYNEQLGLSGNQQYNIVFNGAVIQTLDGRILLNQEMNYNDFNTVLRLQRLSHVKVHFETPECFWTCDHDLPHLMMRNAVETNNVLKVRKREEITHDFTFNKASFTSMNDAQQSEKFWNSLPDWAFAKYNIVHSFPDVIELNAKGASKGAALVDLADRLKINQADVMIFGDQGNDLSMFANPSFKKVAMGNAIELIKDKADYVTDDNDHNGIAKALKKFVL
ncbi:Cof-type HAD-IIB family hydrolase [Lactobacillus sp. ESL0791]|uniref:Cof-type HAD-IIB family hydrolase n=1 Tax=Lactobacillus sp. ESL0791 TaxID=2983234 RepID=UPI0023F91E28|nr:Cof-type HAD-IIB family hydrolase [Lactobacillus sp. ESL0791]MDF7638651.1 Cof-type HAD-IIB family hydrolase [Lactobacillus sp. ESL0791]